MVRRRLSIMMADLARPPALVLQPGNVVKDDNRAGAADSWFMSR